MKMKDNNYYQSLYVRLLKAYDLKRNNHDQLDWYNTYSRLNEYHNYKMMLYNWFNHPSNINDFGFQFRSEEELLINLDLRGL